LGHRRPRNQVGLGPILIDLMRRGFITSLAMNGGPL